MKIYPSIIALSACLFFLGESQAKSKPVLTFTGEYQYRTDQESQEMMGDVVCFYPSGKSVKLVPRSKSDQRLAWFCFDNDKSTRKLLSIPPQKSVGGCGIKGQATVRVTNYTVALGEGEDYDTATLQAVVAKAKPKVLACE